MRPRRFERRGPRVFQGPTRRPHRPDPTRALAQQLRRVGRRVRATRPHRLLQQGVAAR